MTVSEPGTIYCRAELTGTALVYAQWLASQAQRLMDKGELVDDAESFDKAYQNNIIHTAQQHFEQ
ncbi:MAG TPA: hypothetical protein V6D30_04095, partial [Leptolyngbyaceae cyanobacterium]